MNKTSDPFSVHGDSNGSNGAQPAPPSPAQGFVTEICGRVQDFGEDLKETLSEAIHRDLVAPGDPAMQHYKAAVQHVNAAQQALTSVAMPMEFAERDLEAFKATVLHNVRNEMRAPSKSGGADDSQKGPVQRMKTLLKSNKNDAMTVEAGVVSSTFWAGGVACHYRERAELLENIFSGNGDEHSVMILLEDDLRMAERELEKASRVENGGPQLSAVGYVHRDATNRLFKLRNSIRAIAGLQI